MSHLYKHKGLPTIMYHDSTNTRLPTIQVLCLYRHPYYIPRLYKHKRQPTIQASYLYTQETTHHTSVMCLHTRLPTTQASCVYTQYYPPHKHHVYTQETAHHTNVMCLHTKLPTIQASCVYTQDYPPYKLRVYTQETIRRTKRHVYTQETTRRTSVMSTHKRLPTIQASCLSCRATGSAEGTSSR